MAPPPNVMTESAAPATTDAKQAAQLAAGTPAAIAQVLSRNPYFSSLTDAQRTIVAGAFEPVKVAEGTRVITEGQTPEVFLILVHGELDVIAASGKRATLHPYDYLGFKNLFGDARAAHSIVAANRTCLLYQLHRAKFTTVLREHPDVMMGMLPALATHVPDSIDALSSKPGKAAAAAATTAGDTSTSTSPIDRALPADPARFVVKVFDAKHYQIKYFEEQNAAFGYHLDFIESKLTLETVHLCEGAHAVCTFVHDSVTREVADTLAHKYGIRLVAFRCAGFDACDVKACDEMGVSVVRVPSYSPAAIAEHAAAMMLALNRKLNWASARVHTGDFSLDGLVGFDIKGKTIGVVGTGKIGACFGQIALGFGAKVLCHDVYKNPALLANPQVQYVEMDSLLAQSDIISLHAPLLPDTFHLINATTLAKTKRGVMILNTSRGPLVDTPALIEALKTGQVGACGLDVVEGENELFFENHSDKVVTNDNIARLLAFQQNVIITAHQAYLTQEALREIATTTLRNITEFHQGKRMKSLANSVNSV
ncbi:hypothetical protein AMAG_08720 [Allomyces macrogynus ATCC 38327]|uniref:Cyclic nucleotide-binding domain-containing protein n=1 Tax=Allomyces macrogynus (strain ATCC 38327) TaxID=578462 RepID=A0A0L0SMC0_ALLM3|nr:hypothetical protein AMAG_08720 [Allomyces macrogynus ATCC 38327]|eukprot:KNE63618.1 hypothetical protein AMAG_08720 [Allomyces macrogynus ATCC 38327]